MLQQRPGRHIIIRYTGGGRSCCIGLLHQPSVYVWRGQAGRVEGLDVEESSQKLNDVKVA